ncbi:hypothetical protein NPIL_387311, partial [Nephila pilipes]
QERHKTFEMLNTALYVYDLFHGADTVEKVLKLSQSSAEIRKEANMNLRSLRRIRKSCIIYGSREIWLK